MKIKVLIVSFLMLICSIPVLAQNEAALMIPEERMFTVGGWIDLMARMQFTDDIKAVNADNLSFGQADMNLYFKFNPHKDLECFTEIAYGYMPAATEQDLYNLANRSYVNNTAKDFFSVEKEWGTIYIVRAYMEWHKYPFSRYAPDVCSRPSASGARTMARTRSPRSGCR